VVGDRPAAGAETVERHGQRRHLDAPRRRTERLQCHPVPRPPGDAPNTPRQFCLTRTAVSRRLLFTVVSRREGSHGRGELGFALTNTSSTPRRAIGYPPVRFLDKVDAPLPTIAAHTTRDFFGSAPLRRLIVASGARACPSGWESPTAWHQPFGCTTAYHLTVILPDDTAMLWTPIGDGVYECQQTTVSPLQPGDSAYQHGG
jgi:Protein of unknown function (DUF4232)